MKLRVAAIQPRLEVGRVEENLARVEDLVRDAHRVQAPDLIVLPEGFSSPNVYDPRIRAVPRSIDGAPLTLLRQLAAELDCVIAGGALTVRGDDAFGTYMAVEPDGRAHLHDKDIPSGTEQYYNRGGDDDGITEIASWRGRRIGLVSGLEWGRARTARRLRAGRVDVVIGGQCWPWMPTNWKGPIGRWMRDEFQRSIGVCAGLGEVMASHVGAPAVMASHVGPVEMRTPYLPRIPWRTAMVGQTQICDQDGNLLARLGMEDGEGHISAVIELSSLREVIPAPDTYWMIEMGRPIEVVFHAFNAVGAASYKARKAFTGFPWQNAPDVDLPDETAPADSGKRPSRPHREVRVVERREVADNVVELTLAAEGGTLLPLWEPGAHIDVVTPHGPRQYSLCGQPADDRYQIALLRLEDGRGGSAYMHDEVKEGDLLTIRGPRNNFTLDDADRVAFIAGGIGITPIRAMIREAVAAVVDWSLVYGGRCATSMAYADELAAIDPARVRLVCEDEEGPIDLVKVIEVVPADAQVYACGPPGMLDALAALCASDPDRLHVERFLAQTAAREDDEPFEIVCASDGARLVVPVHRTALEVLLDAGYNVDNACRNGVCGSCEVPVIEGEPDPRDLISKPTQGVPARSMMVCVSRARTPSIMLDI